MLGSPVRLAGAPWFTRGFGSPSRVRTAVNGQPAASAWLSWAAKQCEETASRGSLGALSGLDIKGPFCMLGCSIPSIFTTQG